MVKRFTETGKWKDKWYRELPIEYKAFWNYLCDQCDNAGVWKKDIEQANFYLGTIIDEEEALRLFNTNKKTRIHQWGDDLWYLEDYVSFQYGELSENCHPHKQVITLLERYKNKGYSVPLQYPSIRVQDKEKDKEKEKDKDKEKNSDVRFFIAYACQEFLKTTGEKLCVDGKKDGALVKKLLSVYGLEKLKELWSQFMQADDPFIRTAGKSIGVFKSQVNKLLTVKVRKDWRE